MPNALRTWLRTAASSASDSQPQAGITEAWRRGVFCELGLGTGDVAGFLAALRASAYQGWLVVEQDRFLTAADTPAAMLALQTRNREWLRAQGY